MILFKFTRKAAVLSLLLVTSAVTCTLRSQDLTAAIRLTHSERFDAARAAYQKLLAQDPKNGNILFYLGDNFIRKYFADTLFNSLPHLTDSASFAFEKGIILDPANPLCYAGQAEISLLRKNMTDAYTSLDKAISLLPTKKNKIPMAKEQQALAWIKMADAFIVANVSDTGRVFTYLREAEKVDSKNP